MDDTPLFVPHGGKPTRGKRTIGSFEVSRDLLIPDDVRAGQHPELGHFGGRKK